MASEAGFDVRLTAAEYASALTAANRGDFEAFLTAWSGRVDLDGNLFGFLHSDGALNDSKYANPQVDALLEKARTVADIPARRALYADMWKQERQDLPHHLPVAAKEPRRHVRPRHRFPPHQRRPHPPPGREPRPPVKTYMTALI